MRLASATREYRPCESSSTMIICRPLTRACITTQLPASLMKPVFCTVRPHCWLPTSGLVV